MRKIIPLCFGLGGFLLVAGLVALLWAPGAVKKTPLDVNSTTRLSGQAAKLNPVSGQIVTTPVKATSVTKADSKVSDDDVVAFTNSSCLVIAQGEVPDCVAGDDPRLISASTDVFATDRETALAVNTSKYLPADATKHEGVINKWPFGADKKTYPYWDDVVGKAVDAVYARTSEVKGLRTYVYKVSIKDAPIEIADGVSGTYDDAKEIYIEPKTGAIINQTDDQQRTLADGTKALDLQLAFTDAQVKANVDDAEKNVGSLDLITRTVPLVGLVGGAVLVLAGLFLAMSGRGTRKA